MYSRAGEITLYSPALKPEHSNSDMAMTTAAQITKRRPIAIALPQTPKASSVKAAPHRHASCFDRRVRTFAAAAINATVDRTSPSFASSPAL